MSSRGGPSIAGNRSWRMPHDLVRLVDGQRGLGEVAQVLGVGDLDGAGLGGRLHQDRALRRLAGGAHDLLMARVADQHDRAAVLGEPAGLDVHLRDERTGGVDHLEVAGRRIGVDLRCHPVRGQHHDGALGHLGLFIDEDRALGFEVAHDVQVVDDLLADVDRSAVLGQRPLHGVDRALHAGAVASRGRQQHGAPGRGGVPVSMRSMVAGPRVDPPGYDLGSRFGCRMSVGSPRVVGHDTDRPVRSSPARRCATSFPRWCAYACMRPGAGARTTAVVR